MRTQDKTIHLKQDTTMSTGYTGRGVPRVSITVPAGTAVRYMVDKTQAGTYHTVQFVQDGKTFKASIKQP